MITRAQIRLQGFALAPGSEVKLIKPTGKHVTDQETTAPGNERSAVIVRGSD
jgi:hypothetical protein